MRRRKGLTLVDGAILLAVAAVTAVVLVPQRHVRRMMANEDRVVEDLREFERRVVAHQKAGRRDTDGDNVGEFAPLTAVIGDRPGAARRVGATDVWELDGYYFAVMVPGARKLPVLAGSADVSADGAEVMYLLIAWPARPGVTGMRAYLTSPHGILVHQIDGYPYSLEPPAPEWYLVHYDGKNVLRGEPYGTDKADWKAPGRTLAK